MQGPRLLMSVALHMGTLGSILAVYRSEAWEVVRGSAGAIVPGRWGRGAGGTASDPDRRALVTAIAVIEVAMVTAPIGFWLEPHVEALGRDMCSLGGLFLITALLLFGTRFLAEGRKEIGYLLALPIGVAQGLAVFPGISRSGITIVAALALGLGREEAVRFSFLAAIPVLVGAMILEGGFEAAEIASRWPVYLAGAVVAFAVGWASLRVLIGLTVRRRLHWFAPYLAVLGLALVFWR